jgi:hypothetical protein
MREAIFDSKAVIANRRKRLRMMMLLLAARWRHSVCCRHPFADGRDFFAG